MNSTQFASDPPLASPPHVSSSPGGDRVTCAAAPGTSQVRRRPVLLAHGMKVCRPTSPCPLDARREGDTAVGGPRRPRRPHLAVANPGGVQSSGGDAPPEDGCDGVTTPLPTSPLPIGWGVPPRSLQIRGGGSIGRRGVPTCHRRRGRPGDRQGHSGAHGRTRLERVTRGV